MPWSEIELGFAVLAYQAAYSILIINTLKLRKV